MNFRCHGEKDNVVFEIANPLNLLSRSESDKKYFILSNGTLLPQDTGEEFVKALNDELAAADKSSAGSISGCVRNASVLQSLLSIICCSSFNDTKKTIKTKY